MTDRNKLKDRARDELFSHINRCGVLQAEEDDQQHWMEETMDYLGERYPDLAESDLKDLFQLGMRFCRPAIPHGRPGSASKTEVDATGEEAEVEAAEVEAAGDRTETPESVESPRQPVGAGAEDSPTA
ncbi:MAG: hypothetical protein EA351_09845 [Gemmatimonadales bacterium]|nr:MAG: hypothetical protein EA351_09845 [Gemmatimonadales bacterium]